MCLPAGLEDKRQIDGINRLIKAMQEMASPIPAPPPSNPQVATSSSGQVIAKTGSASTVAKSGNSGSIARSGNMQTAAMRSGTPVGTSYRDGSGATPPSHASSASSLDRSQAVQGGNAAETIQQAVQMLQWFVQEAGQLPAAARLEALR